MNFLESPFLGYSLASRCVVGRPRCDPCVTMLSYVISETESETSALLNRTTPSPPESLITNGNVNDDYSGKDMPKLFNQHMEVGTATDILLSDFWREDPGVSNPFRELSVECPDSLLNDQGVECPLLNDQGDPSSLPCGEDSLGYSPGLEEKSIMRQQSTSSQTKQTSLKR